MCLSHIESKFPPKFGVGWKSFKRGGNGELYSEFYWTIGNNSFDGHIKRGMWRMAEHTILYTHESQPYVSGFHLWTEKPKSTKKPTKVYYRGGRILGIQNCSTIIVADEIYVPKRGERPKGWKAMMRLEARQK